MKIFFDGTELLFTDLTEGDVVLSSTTGELPQRIELVWDTGVRYRLTGDQIREVALSKVNRTAVFAVVLPPIADADGWKERSSFSLVASDKGLTVETKPGELKWLEDVNVAPGGKVDSFCADGGEKQHDSHALVPSMLGYVSNASHEDSYRSFSSSVGVFAADDGALSVLVVVSAKYVSSRPGTNIRYRCKFTLPALGKTPVQIIDTRPDGRRVVTTFHALPLSGNADHWASGWLGQPRAQLDPFFSAYSPGPHQLLEGAWLDRNSQPWAAIPTVPEEPPSNWGCLGVFTGDIRAPRWAGMVPVRTNAEKPEVMLCSYQWQAFNRVRNPMELKVSLTDHAAHLRRDGNSRKDAPVLGGGIVKTLISAVSFTTAQSDLGELDARLTLKVTEASLRKEDRLNLGAVELTVPFTDYDVGNNDSLSRTTLRLVLKGNDEPRYEGGTFPSAVLENLPVGFRLGGTADRHRKAAEFDSAGVVEDRLHGPTDAITESLGAKVGVGAKEKSARLSIRTNARFGQDFLTEIELAESRVKYTHSEMLFFQAKPFLYAKVSGIEKDPEGGSLLARWRSDDPDGPQWRFPYSEATLELPAQAVGEEMERGERFWEETSADGAYKSYIDDKQPIRYRFSPSTSVTIAPDIGRRRFNPAPGNAFRLIHDGSVTAFRTEMAYPIAIGYRQDPSGTKALRMRETGAFLGRGVPNLPIATNSDRSTSIVDDVLEGGLATWVQINNNNSIAFDKPYKLLRLNNSANRANLSARIAQLHVFDPLQSNFGLSLSEGLQFELRSHRPKPEEKQGPFTEDTKIRAGQTPPLRNPLPVRAKHNDVPPGPHGRDRIVSFLSGKDLAWGTDDEGAFRGGVLHTIEFPSELIAVLADPKSNLGTIDSLSFSNLGATGEMSVGFDNGLTRFTVDVQNGQISRLLKTRIGRIGVTWNRAKHIVVYERTVLPSTQFDSQQKRCPHIAWPILRKTEEYVEPIDVVREFAKESDAEQNSAGFLNEFEFVSKRVYVDSGWGEEFSVSMPGQEMPTTGYELPLWDGGTSEAAREMDAESSWYYPKPKLAFVSRGNDGAAVRQWVEDPDELVFYTIAGGDGDPNVWPGISGIDAPKGIFRLGVLSPTPGNWDAFISGPAPSVPRRDALRRRRFELRVRSDAAVDLQSSRSDKPMFAAVSLLSVARSGEASSIPRGLMEPLSDPATDPLNEIRKRGQALRRAADWSGRVGDITAPIDRWIKDLPKKMAQFSCGKDSIDGWKRELQTLEKMAISRVHNVFEDLTNLEDLRNQAALPSSEGLRKRLTREITGTSLVDPMTITAFTEELREYIDESVLGSAEKLSEDQRNEVHADLSARFVSIQKKLQRARDLIIQEIVDPSREMSGAVTDLSTKLQELRDSLLALVAGLSVPTNDVSDDIDAAREKLGEVSAQLIEVDKRPLRGVIAQTRRLVETADQILMTAKVVVEENEAKAKVKVKEGLTNASEFISEFAAQMMALGSRLTSLNSTLTETVHKRIAPVSESLCGLQTGLDNLLSKTDVEIKEQVAVLREHLVVSTDNATNSAISALVDAERSIKNDLLAEVNELTGSTDTPLMKAYDQLVKVYASAMKQFVAGEDTLLKTVSAVFESAYDNLDKLRELEDTAEDFCKKVKDEVRSFAGALETRSAALSNELSNAMTAMLDETTNRAMEALDDLEVLGGETTEALRQQYGASIGQTATGLKLAKAIGDMPALPDLTFNVDRAEYVFDDIRDQIETSPFGARMKEIDAGLKELGINVPSTAILDQVLPTSEDISVGFNKIVDSMGGLDFSDMFDRFRLPEIKKDQYQITHGVDEKNRTAWVKSAVQADYPSRQAMFEEGPFGIFSSNMQLRGNSEVRINIKGQRSSEVRGVFRADWAMQFGGVDLATFRDVAVVFDGNDVKFDVDPSKIDYHPSLQFISDVAKLIQGEMPAGVTLLKDERGMPIGAEAKMVTLIENPPPLGPVILGPLSMEGGLSLLLSNKGQFVIRSFAGVGSKSTPIFVQIGVLGGGAWAVGAIENGPSGSSGKRVTQFTGSVGLALGTVAAINIAGVAKGSYSLLLFANAEFSSTGGVLRAGLSIQGSARLLSIATIYVYLLLQVEHSSEGGGTATGQLSAKVKMSKFYTLRVRKAVSQKL